MSSNSSVDSGIGQGTILGPLYFILYLNHLVDLLDDSAPIKLYADDAKLYGCPETDQNPIQDNLDTVAVFISDWQLKINAEKCHVLHMGHSNQRITYTINGTAIAQASSCSDLGVEVSDDMKASTHCVIICRKTYFKMRQFHFALSCRDIGFQLYIYKTYIRPLL